MPVSPCRVNLLQDAQEFYSFLLACQEKSQRKGCPLIVSLSQEIDPVDPLAILQAIASPNELSFYWENRRNFDAIAAIGSIQKLTLNSPNRFDISQDFIQKCVSKTIQIGQTESPWAGLHFFCSFTFFSSLQYLDSPFPTATIFLPRIQVAKHKNQCVLVTNINIDSETNLENILDNCQSQWQKIQFIKDKIKSKSPNSLKKLQNSPTQFKSVVNQALNAIQLNKLSKIVLAHALDVTSENNFNVIQSIDNLRQRHPDCYIFSTGNGKGNFFLGASPERLISIQNSQLITDALAGSAPRGKTASEDANLAKKLLNSEKEKREHQAVSEFILQRLKELDLNPTRSPLQLLQLSNIQHLWTPIQATLPSHLHPLDIVSKLHPTPAVAGVPTAIACEKIQSFENFDRALYAAPLGWVDSQGNGEFIVGIRSAMISGNQAKLYAGAGIVAGSNPDKELAEIQLKLQTMLKALA
ncbi:MAG: isochorismate synthase [Chroococcales cyanobacterium]